VVRKALRFLRRCWTGEDLTVATGIGGCVMFVGMMWFIETSASSGLRAFGVTEPAATIGGWAVTGTYVVVAATHDWLARRRREERNEARQEIRQALTSVGLEKLVRGSGRVVDTDLDILGERRRLWRIDDVRGDELLVAVEVVNSSLEADGSRRSYFIRVPPRTRTCRAAVAWTFGLEAHQYAPSVET
jgi:hypothetical protein